ncbi:hypothetical protein PCE1_004345 [Barthelona sp. PCE]
MPPKKVSEDLKRGYSKLFPKVFKNKSKKQSTSRVRKPKAKGHWASKIEITVDSRDELLKKRSRKKHPFQHEIDEPIRKSQKVKSPKDDDLVASPVVEINWDTVDDIPSVSTNLRPPSVSTPVLIFSDSDSDDEMLPKESLNVKNGVIYPVWFSSSMITQHRKQSPQFLQRELLALGNYLKPSDAEKKLRRAIVTELGNCLTDVFLEILLVCDRKWPKKSTLNTAIQEKRDILSEMLSVKLYGSSSTNLVLPLGDVDISLSIDPVLMKILRAFNDEVLSMQGLFNQHFEVLKTYNIEFNHDIFMQFDNRYSGDIPLFALHMIKERLLKSNVGKCVQVISSASIPIVKLQHRSGLLCDISFNQMGGYNATKFVVTVLNELPHVFPIVLVLKQSLAARYLNEAYTGGLGSYGLLLYIIAFAQNRWQLYPNLSTDESVGLSQFFWQLLHFYSKRFNFRTHCIVWHNDRAIIGPKNSLLQQFNINLSNLNAPVLMDPVDPTLNVTRGCFNIGAIHRLFRWIYDVITTKLSVRTNASNHSFLESLVLKVATIEEKSTLLNFFDKRVLMRQKATSRHYENATSEDWTL